MKNAVLQIRKTPFLIVCMLLSSLAIFAQSEITVKGTVLYDNDEPVIGANVVVKENRSIGTITDIDGNFQLTIPSTSSTLLVTYVGMEAKEVKVGNNVNFRIVLKEDGKILEEVVVVGYGQQKKASVIGAITQTNAKVLERAGGVSSLGSALTGNLPGVITYSSTGMPGAEDPKIVIRGQSSWNNSDPLILVDGIEREMSSVDISSVETISVLKDASATAVYGVKGANGVILITTKRGHEGKAVIDVKANATVKVISKLPQKYDAYDTFLLRNDAIERELLLTNGGWVNYKPMGIIDKYRNPANTEEWDRYANVDWEDVLFKDYTMSYNTNINVSGGTKFVNYFAAIDFLNEGDIFKTFNNNRNYASGYGFNRINVRSNLDFNLTKTTRFSTNLFGSSGTRRTPWDASDDSKFWAAAYRTAPDAMRPVYSNGMWGFYSPQNADVPNSMYALATGGLEKITTTKINTDFILSQKLDMVTKGLDLRATFSIDNEFREVKRGIQDGTDSQRMWVDPETGKIVYQHEANSGTQIDYYEGINWKTKAGEVDKGKTYRKMYYSLQLNYGRKFGKHDVGAMGLFSREESARGSVFKHYREDWVFRTTYNYDLRYFTEINGAYNGSEKFGPNNRFAFFPSFTLGWMLSEEKFMENIKFLDMLKFRASWGRIGDDNVGDRWLYQDQWSYGGNTFMGYNPAKTPYTYYRITSLGNENISWETVEKRNFAIDYSFFNGIVAGSFDIFSDKRTDILIKGDQRAVPSYFGVNAPYVNAGKVSSKGYELELRLSYKFANNLRLWGNFNMTHAENKTNFRDDAPLLPAYQKREGHAIGQTTSFLESGHLQSWDDVYGSTERSTSNGNKLPGDYNIIDFNGDGTIDADDKAPYQYTGVPQNTFSSTVGMEWKGFSLTVQFYGVNNVTREVTFPTFLRSSNVAFKEGSFWHKEKDGGLPIPRWSTLNPYGAEGTRYLYDGSYLRLKNAELAYTFTGKFIEKLKMKACRVYLNGDNLLLWTNMPDDRESNFGGSSSFGAYPTVRRFNIGINVTL